MVASRVSAAASNTPSTASKARASPTRRASMAVGVTTFIGSTLANGTRPPSGGFKSRSFATDGLRIGRETDMLVRKAFTKTLALNSGIRKHARAIEFFRVMAAANLTVCDVQRAVGVLSLNLRTTIDCMAKDNFNNDVVRLKSRLGCDTVD